MRGSVRHPGDAPIRHRTWAPSVGDDLCAESSDQPPHFVLANSGCVGPLSEPDPPILPGGAWIPGCQDDVKVAKPVAEYKAVDVLGLGHRLQCSGQTIHQDSEGPRS